MSYKKNMTLQDLINYLERYKEAYGMNSMVETFSLSIVEQGTNKHRYLRKRLTDYLIDEENEEI